MLECSKVVKHHAHELNWAWFIDYAELHLFAGRNNIISGVAKTIRTHFMKYPLAIVNIKGRAKGTSVQELIFELEVCSARSWRSL